MDEEPFTLAVETDDEGRPRRLRLGIRDIDIAEVTDHWPGADHDYFRLRDREGRRYIVRYDHRRGSWHLVLYEHGRPPAPERSGH